MRALLTLIAALVLLLPTAGAVPTIAVAAQDDGEIDPIDQDEDDITPDDDDDDDVPLPTAPPAGDDGEVEPIGEYRVEVLCRYTPAARMSECAFTGMPPAGAPPPSYLLVPAEIACASVAGGQHVVVSPDPSVGLPGYRTAGEPWLTLVLEGVAEPAGAATYWFQTDAGVVPGTGPALACAPAPREPSPAQPSPTPTPRPETGTLVVSTRLCAEVPADREGFDWFAACPPLEYALLPAQQPATPVTAMAADAAWRELAPGEYDLDLLGYHWCHARSDNVSAESKVVIEAGERTTVWIFLCLPRGA